MSKQVSSSVKEAEKNSGEMKAQTSLGSASEFERQSTGLLPCRSCGNVDYHHRDCPFFKDGWGPHPVLHGQRGAVTQPAKSAASAALSNDTVESSVPHETKSESSSSPTSEAMIEAIRKRSAKVSLAEIASGANVIRRNYKEHVADFVAHTAADINFLLTELDRLKAMIADATQIEMSLRAQLDKAGVERDMLGDAIARVAIKAEIIDGKSPLTGPQLLMLCDDVSTELNRRAEEVQAQMDLATRLFEELTVANKPIERALQRLGNGTLLHWINGAFSILVRRDEAAPVSIPIPKSHRLTGVGLTIAEALEQTEKRLAELTAAQDTALLKPPECRWCAAPEAYFPAEPYEGKMIHFGRDGDGQVCTATAE